MAKKEEDRMAENEPYGIMPYSEIADLKKQMKKFQEKDSVGNEELTRSVSSLTRNMESMAQLLRTAMDEMKIEEEEEKAMNQQLRPVMEKLEEILEQNKIIAEGLIALSDLIKEKLPEQRAEENIPKKPVQPGWTPDIPPAPGQPFMPPTEGFGDPFGMDMPPPPGSAPFSPSMNMPPDMPPPPWEAKKKK